MNRVFSLKIQWKTSNVRLSSGAGTALWCVIVITMGPMDVTGTLVTASAMDTGLEKNARRMMAS